MAKLTTIFDAKDSLTGKLKSITGKAKELRTATQKPITLDAKDKTTKKIKTINQSVSKLRINAEKPALIKAKDKATEVVKRVSGFVQKFSRGSYKASLWVIDRATKTIRYVSNSIQAFGGMTRKATLRVIDGASRVVGTIKRALFSIPTLITVGLSVVGIGSLGKSTVGSAMTWEGYQVSMRHWLGGDVEKADALTNWVGQFADKTPFGSADLMPAMTRGIGLTSGNIDEAKTLLKIATDMSSLTPGTSVGDAMEALGDAQMGEFERMKNFNMKMDQKTFKKIGWSGFLKDVEKTFEGGAEKLSSTAFGQLSTLKGYASSFLRSIGTGVLDNMKPRLDTMINFLDENQEGWGNLKKAATDAASSISGAFLDKVSGALNLIKTKYLDDPEFMNADWKGKVDIISSDVKGWWSSKGKPQLQGWWQSSGRPWAVSTGALLGEALFQGIVTGVKAGIGTLGNIWKDAIQEPSVKSLGGAAAATVLAGGLASTVLGPVLKGAGHVVGGGKKVYQGGKKLAGKIPKRPDDGLMKASPIEKISKAFGGMGGAVKSASKKLPLIGSLLGVAHIATSGSKGEAASRAGGVAGGFAGAKAGGAAGAAFGSVVPGVGTAVGGAVGGIAGGVLGAIGGEKAVKFVQSNLDNIKNLSKSTWEKAHHSASVAWDKISTGSSNAWASTKEGASNLWSSISDGASKAGSKAQEIWGTFSSWVNDNVWVPFRNGAINGINFVVGVFVIGKELLTSLWGTVSGWFNDTVWTPLKEAGSLAWDWISLKATQVWTALTTIWGAFTGWFIESVWTPLSESANLAWDWIKLKAYETWTGLTELWGTFTGWFMETVWTPLSETASLVWQGILLTAHLTWLGITAFWGMASGWFMETVWTPLSSAASSTWNAITGFFVAGWGLVTSVWGAASGWFQSVVWNPISSSVDGVRQAIVGAFESAWASISGIFANISEMWNKVTGWVGGGVSHVIGKGEKATGLKPANNASGGYIQGKTLSWLAEEGPEFVIPVKTHKNRGRMLVQQAASALGMNVGNSYGDPGISDEELPMFRATSGSTTQVAKTSGDINVNFNGDNNYYDDMDAEKVGKIAVQAVSDYIEEEFNESGDVAYG